MAIRSALALHDDRALPRDEVHYRARVAGANGRDMSALVVNISAGGLMMRSDADLAVEEQIRVKLPVIGPVSAQVRWSLGGRIGCRFDAAIPLACYHEMLAMMVKRR